MKQYAMAMDLKDDPALIAEYEKYHRQVWPSILDSLEKSGILKMEIFRIGNRLFMLMETHDHFDPNEKAKLDAINEDVQHWEELMWNYQQALPWANKGEKWMEMEKIFEWRVGNG